MLVRNLFFGLLCCLLGSCKQVRKISDAIVQPSPREVYARGFSDENRDYSSWKNAYQSALNDSLTIDLPYLEIGSFTPDNFSVYVYESRMQQGEKLVVDVGSVLDSTAVFIDVFKLKSNDSINKEAVFREKGFGNKAIEFPIEETARYKISIQPELYASDSFQIEIYTKPTLAFPVADVSDKAIQSFWGAPRSGGKRSHEGVDIFAPRLTPVLAVSNGRAGYTGEKGLGGKQVWLRGGIFKKSFYYAHLDSIKVATGDKVTVGDTLGFVGNTGNARTTAPHLHFGVYTAGGAINPLPFIRYSKRLEAAIAHPLNQGFIKNRNANLRISPNIKSQIITTLKQKDTLTILGRTTNWYHVQSKAEEKGFLYKSLLTEFKVEKARSSR